MGDVNKDMNINEMSTMMKNYQKEAMKMEMNQEVMTDAMDMGDAQGEEADEVYNSILGEIGLSMDEAGTVGTNAIASKAPVIQIGAGEE